MSRARLIKPGFFGDASLGKVSRDSRLAFGGIWTECDDQGYFEWHPEELAWTLFRFDADKQEVIDRALLELTSVGVVEQLACGIHGLIDSMPEHRIQGGNHSSNFERQHQRECLSGPVRTRQDAPAPALRPDVSIPVRTERDTTPAEAKVRTGPDESLSESESESLKRREKNVLEEGVVVENEAGASASVVDETTPLTRPSSLLPRPRASTPAPAGDVPAVTVPSRLEALTPRWRTPCTSYVAHQSRHRIVDGLAVCDACEELGGLVPPAKANGAAAAPQPSLEL